MSLRIPNRIPACIPVITIIRNKLITAYTRNRKGKRKSCAQVMMAVNIYFYPVAGKLVPPAHSFYNRVRGIVMTLVADIKKLVIVKDLEICLLGGRFTFVGLVLCKI